MRAPAWRRFTFLLTAIVVAAVPLAVARQNPAVTAADYARAEKFLAQNVTNLVVGGSVAANWLTIGSGTEINSQTGRNSSSSIHSRRLGAARSIT